MTQSGEILEVVSTETGGQYMPWLPVPGATLPEHIASHGSDAPSHRLIELRFGLRSLPYLGDHGFHDMAVLPGSFYIALARQLHRELFHREATTLQHIEFERPVILSDEDMPLTVRVENGEDGRVAYAFFDATSEVVEDSPAQQPCARLQVEPGGFFRFADNAEAFRETGLAESAEQFYGELRRNGNQYGPSFRVFETVLREETQIAGRFADKSVIRSRRLWSPPLLDGCAQLLSGFALDRGRTFILKSIDRLDVGSLKGAESWQARATQTNAQDAGQGELIGSVEVFAGDGTRLLELAGVTLAFIDRPAAAETASAQDLRICVASTFTAEPLEDSLRFWAEQFGRKARIEFAPYNQVFQQLLDPASAFRGNRDGVNLIVLGLEDWLQADRQPILQTASPARAAASFGDRQRYTLPNGLEIVHLNQYETDYVYQEIFEDQSYLRHDIQLADGDTVIDIGANIGLFSLFVMSRCKDPSIYSFEPSPRVFDLLQANCAAYGNPGKVRAFNYGVAEKKGQATFTFYEKSSVFSSFHPDKGEDRAAVEAVVRNVLQNELAEVGDMQDEDVQDLTEDRLEAQSIECSLTSVSDIIRENGLTRIQLLKIDAEKSEIGILKGIAEEHWPMIEQIVMEVHDRTRAAVEAIEEQLTQRGFRCAVVEERLLEDSGLFNIYATRKPPSATAVNAAEAGLQSKVDEFCAAFDTFVEANSTPSILAIAPRSSGAANSVLDAAEKRVLDCAARYRQVQTIGSETILSRYPVSQLHDPHGHQLGHMPYTPEGYAAVGTALFRGVFNVGKRPVKVLVLDCDNTLWQGLAGEDGPMGVALTPGFLALQEFAVRQSGAGVLVALCSKNQEADVLAVFDQRADMPLRREHLAGWQINWESKPANLRALAAQLNLGLDSFVFIDDNPVECAEVRAGCPEVTVLRLPSEHERIPAFLQNLWIFDPTPTTAADRERSQFYRTNLEREEQRAAAPTLRDFLNGLQLQIDVAEATSEQLERVSQLTVRTNQFNFTTIRRSEAEIREMLKAGAKCLVTSVRDRFGDYGLVGVTLYTSAADRYIVDTLLLSCRALGKGVEHRMVAELAQRAFRDGKTLVEMSCRTTDRNEPARDFLNKLAPAGSAPKGGEVTIEVPAAALSELRYNPEDRTDKVFSSIPAASEGKKASAKSAFGPANLSAVMQRLGDELSSIEAVVAAIDSSRQQSAPAVGDAASVTPVDASSLEQLLVAIWKKALGRPSIGLHENFFDAGGTSLKAVVVIAMIRKELKKDVSVITLFECPSITLLAARLEGSSESESGASSAAANAESRGRQRRNKLVKRRTA